MAEQNAQNQVNNLFTIHQLHLHVSLKISYKNILSFNLLLNESLVTSLRLSGVLNKQYICGQTNMMTLFKVV